MVRAAGHARRKRAGEAGTHNSHVGGIPGDRDSEPADASPPGRRVDRRQGRLCDDRQVAPAALDLYRDRLPRSQADEIDDVFERGDRPAVEALDEVAGHEARGFGRAAGDDAADPRGHDHLAGEIGEAGEDEKRRKEIGGRPGGHDRGPRRQRLRGEARGPLH